MIIVNNNLPPPKELDRLFLNRKREKKIKYEIEDVIIVVAAIIATITSRVVIITTIVIPCDINRWVWVVHVI